MIRSGDSVGGRYKLDAEIGRGGMGTVWSALHVATGKRVAVKVLRRSDRPDLVRRFIQEARVACAIEHPNVVTVHDLFMLDDGAPAMVMDLLVGETLAALFAREAPLDPAVAASLLLPVVSAVGTAHAAGVVHRDLKPDNVFLLRGATGALRVRVLDFGVAKLAGHDHEGTDTGAVLGTPAYMAPEQGFGERVDHRADIWALGAMLYEALSGARPIDGENVAQVVRRLLTDGIAPLSVVAPDAPADLATLVDSMLSREPHQRPADLRAVASTLAAYAPDVDVPAFGAPGALGALPAVPTAELSAGVRGRRPLAFVAIASAVAAVAALGWSLRPTPPTPRGVSSVGAASIVGVAAPVAAASSVVVPVVSEMPHDGRAASVPAVAVAVAVAARAGARPGGASGAGAVSAQAPVVVASGEPTRGVAPVTTGLIVAPPF